MNRTEDFTLDGAGGAAPWATADWLVVRALASGAGYPTRAKVLYSSLGLYCLFDCADRIITTTGLKDGDDLWHEDVVEAFFWPDERQRVYFEYELSPLVAELPLLVVNDGGRFMGWSPWHYDGERRVARATAVRGGERKAGAKVTGWTAEFFIPFALLRGLGNTPPQSGSRWRANFYRIDHDAGSPALHAWAPVEKSFHEFDRFGTIEFV